MFILSELIWSSSANSLWITPRKLICLKLSSIMQNHWHHINSPSMWLPRRCYYYSNFATAWRRIVLDRCSRGYCSEWRTTNWTTRSRIEWRCVRSIIITFRKSSDQMKRFQIKFIIDLGPNRLTTTLYLLSSVYHKCSFWISRVFWMHDVHYGSHFARTVNSEKKKFNGTNQVRMAYSSTLTPDVSNADVFNCKLRRCWLNAAIGIPMVPVLGRLFIVK